MDVSMRVSRGGPRSGSFACRVCGKVLPTNGSLGGHVARAHKARATPIEQRFLSKIKRDEATGCWNWTARRDPKGYGEIGGGPGRNKLRAYRVAYELYVGTIPPGLFVCHACDNPSCVNPAHLWLGTNADNIRDAAKKGRMPRGGQRSMLTEAQVREIRDRHDIPAREFAARFGVSYHAVRSARERRTWKHIT